MEKIELGNRQILLDGAHNELAIRQLLKAIDKKHRGKIIIVFGALLGHGLKPMMNLLKQLGGSLVAVRSRHPKAVRSQEIGKVAEKTDINVLGVCESVSSGLRLAVEASNEPQIVLVTGSISVVAEAREYVLGIVPEVYNNIRIVEKPGI
jgi:dihydrofolate synthase/folylpolyglutamate synthase